MDRIILSPEDRRYAKEFRASPFGPHSPRLQQIVNVFRAGPAKGKFVLIATSPHREWALGRLTGERACLVEVFEDCTFTSLVEAEWEVFKLRWVANRGPALDGETLLEPGEAVPARPPITLIGYADHITVRPGETIQFMVSSDTGAGYEAEIVRLICGDVNPQGPGYKEERVKTSVSGRYRGRRQEISAGSHVVVPGSPALTSLSVAAMIWPTLPGDGVPQSLLANFSDEERRGFVLRLDEAGAVALSVGDGRRVETVSTALPVRAREWAWVGASFDGASGRAVVFQRGLRRYPQIETEGRAERTLAVRIGPGAAPVTLAAHVREGVGEEAVMAGHYNGKIDSPRLAKAALSGEDIERLQHEPLALGDDLLAAWDFGREIPTTRVLDVGPNALHGRTVNLPARAMKGWNWSGREMSWRHASAEYGAIHFHDDDLYDARWEADFELVVPAEMRSGLYAARLKQGASEDYIPFYVRPARGAHRADILFLAPTASYLAYGNFMLALQDDLYHRAECLTHVGDSQAVRSLTQCGEPMRFAMAAPIDLRNDFDSVSLRRLAKRTRDATQSRRLLALAEVYDGGSRTDASRIGGVGLQIIRDWVLRFNARGPDGLVDGKSPGAPSKLNADHRRALAEVVEAGPVPAVDGVVRWRRKDLARWLLETFAISLDETTVGRELKALGFAKISARPRHLRAKRAGRRGF